MCGVDGRVYSGRMLTALLVSALAAASASPSRAALSEEERRIVANVDAGNADAVALLERLVNVNSGTMNHAGVRAVGRALADELEPLGFSTRWIDMPPEMDRAGHLFAERRGTHGKRVLLIGHLDTVFEADSPFQTFGRDGDVARGPGTEDMKGGDVVIVSALKALHAAGALEGTTIVVAMTGDEENAGLPMSVSRRDLIEAGRSSDAALEFEGLARDGGRDAATLARRSVTDWTLEVTGKRAHSSGIFGKEEGYGAVFEMARILDGFRRELAGEAHLTLNPALVLGGTEVTHDGPHDRGSAEGKTNVIAPAAVASGDVRTLSNEQFASARRRMEAIVARHLPETSASLSFSEGYPAMSPTPGNRALLDRLNDVCRALGVPEMIALDPDLRGAGDSSFVAPVVPTLAGLGVHGSGGHTPEERIDLTTLPLQTKRAAILIYRLTR
jgi:glutamate carboxypeptidase